MKPDIFNHNLLYLNIKCVYFDMSWLIFLHSTDIFLNAHFTSAKCMKSGCLGVDEECGNIIWQIVAL